MYLVIIFLFSQFSCTTHCLATYSRKFPETTIMIIRWAHIHSLPPSIMGRRDFSPHWCWVGTRDLLRPVAYQQMQREQRPYVCLWVDFVCANDLPWAHHLGIVCSFNVGPWPSTHGTDLNSSFATWSQAQSAHSLKQNHSAEPSRDRPTDSQQQTHVQEN